MPAPIPDELTDLEDQILWRDLTRLQENYAGENPTLFFDKNDRFRGILKFLVERLGEANHHQNFSEFA